jgi:hypothetical protein
MRHPAIGVVLTALACGPAVAVDGDAGGTTSTGPHFPSWPTDVTTNVITTADPDGSSTFDWEPVDPRDWPASFISDPDGASVSITCDLWDQDCPPGEKCMPWANDGGNSWNGTRCSPIAPDPGQPGDPCTVEGSGVSGVDSCDVASMCWGVDPETNEGTCVAFCTGSENNPICFDPGTTCSINGEGTLILCLPTCDPLVQDCADGEGCWGVHADFVCAPDASGDDGSYADPCEYLNACDPGLACLPSELVPGCQASGCCSPFCHLDQPNNCYGASQACIPWFEPGQSPPGYEHVGVCGIPK